MSLEPRHVCSLRSVVSYLACLSSLLVMLGRVKTLENIGIVDYVDPSKNKT